MGEIKRRAQKLTLATQNQTEKLLFVLNERGVLREQTAAFSSYIFV